MCLFRINFSNQKTSPLPLSQTFCPPHRDRGQQAFRHVGHYDADEEDDGLQPGVAQDKRQDEEAHAQEDGHAGDDMDEMFNFDADGRLAHLQFRRQGGDAAHHSLVTSGYHNATSGAWWEAETLS